MIKYKAFGGMWFNPQELPKLYDSIEEAIKAAHEFSSKERQKYNDISFTEKDMDYYLIKEIKIQEGSIIMDERRYNTLTLSANHYRTREEYYTAIGRVITILQENDYTIEIPRRECDLTIIHYNYADPQMGTPMPFWLTPEEEESVNYED